MSKVVAMRKAVPLFIILVTVAAGACSGRHSSGPAAGEVKVQIKTVGFDDQSGAHFVLLEELNGKRVLPIMIGEGEARAIMLAMHGVKPRRPLTIDLVGKVLAATGNHVERVVIADLRDEIYYAEIYLNHGEYRVDGRPSDAIALAMNADAPIYVASQVFKLAGLKGRGSHPGLPQTVSGLGITAQELTADLASDFNVEPATGVLVASAAGEAAHAGVQSGDVITRVEEEQVASLADFRRAIARLKGAGSAKIALKRAGRELALTINYTAANSR